MSGFRRALYDVRLAIFSHHSIISQVGRLKYDGKASLNQLPHILEVTLAPGFSKPGRIKNKLPKKNNN